MTLRNLSTLRLIAPTLFGADPLSSLKKLQDDGIGGSALSAINACQPLAPSPFGSFIPPNVTVPVPGSTITTAPITLPGPFPITIPAQTLTIPASTATIPGSAFLPPPPRLCPIATIGNTAGNPPQPPGKSHFTFNLVIDFSTYLSNGSGGGCSQASGTLTLTKDDNGNNPDTVSLAHTGLVCDATGILSTKTYTATYYITGGTGKYAGALGTGSTTASFDAVRTLIHLDGNVLFQ